MFLPNTTGTLTPKIGRNRQGDSTFGTPRTVECAIVRLSPTAGKTSVRADSSASRGNAEEVTMHFATILFPATVTIRIGDRFDIQGFTLKVESVEPRLSVVGRLDHHECQFGAFVP